MANNIQLKLDVPFEEKDSAKTLGAKWSVTERTWYVPHGTDILLFEKWWPVSLVDRVLAWGKQNNVPTKKVLRPTQKQSKPAAEPKGKAMAIGKKKSFRDKKLPVRGQQNASVV